MDSSVQPSFSSARKRRAPTAATGSAFEPAADPYRTLELSGENSGNGSAASSARDPITFTQALRGSTDSSPGSHTLLEVPQTPGTPQKNPVSPASAAMRRQRRGRPSRSLHWRLLFIGLLLTFLSLMTWVVYSGSVSAPPPHSDASTARTNATKKSGKGEGKGKATKSSVPPSPTSLNTAAGKAHRTTSIATTTEEPTTTTTTEEPTTTTTTTTEEPTTTLNMPLPPIEPSDSVRSTWAVLVKHTSAEPLTGTTCGEDGATACNSVYVKAASLPAWTLHVFPKNCVECADPGLYLAATQGAALNEPHGVFASVAGPLGRVGPMLFAMSSVTNDVSVRAELPKWSWLRHVHPSLSTRLDGGAEAAAEGGSARRSYLAVMGVPSTDQPARVALRTAQRATWMTYQEVARAENNFDGALLPLYLFAAVEPSKGKTQRHRRFNADLVTPSLSAFAAATASLQRGKGDVETHVAYEERRVALRSDWREKSVLESPCRSAETTTVTSGATSTPLSYLSHVLDLPITPAAVAAAEFICHASAALWQEALEHRNVVWIDMMTDRRPTTKKKLGDTTKWGLPVEVGMSQKLILWLEYAYHAFGDVPYIVKGDDDAYLKVPQYLSDIRYVRGGARHRVTSPFGESEVAASASIASATAAAAAAAAATAAAAPQDDAGSLSSIAAADSGATIAPECVYWGSMRSFNEVMFNAGMTFMAHRKLVQSVLAPAVLLADAVDIVDLAMQEFDAKKSPVYRAARLHQEDIMLGLRIHAARTHAASVCGDGRIWYVMEGLGRFHDMHRGKMHDVTWSTVVAHRCTPADTYYLHYFFQQEHLVNHAVLSESSGLGLEAVATEQATQWVAAQVNESLPGVVGWDDLPSVVWSHPEEGVPTYAVNAKDGVAVYHNAYPRWVDRVNNVEYGFKAKPVD